MKKIVNDERLMVKICDLYYNKNISQKKIAEEFNFSRPTVSRILSAAKEKGIVKINIENIEESKYIRLEMALEKLFSLRDVIIVDTIDDIKRQKEESGKAVAKYMEKLLKNNYTIGISMGSTLATVAEYIRKMKAEDLIFIPLIGGMGHIRIQMHSNNIAEKMARKAGGNYILMHAPARVSSTELKNELLKEEGIKKVIEMTNKLDVALVGIGIPEEGSALIATGYSQKDYMGNLKLKDVVGDICMQFYDINGKTAPFKNDNTVIGVDIKKLKKVPYSVAVACGLEKKNAIIGAIRGKYINILVTDLTTAEELVKVGKETQNNVN